MASDGENPSCLAFFISRMKDERGVGPLYRSEFVPRMSGIWRIPEFEEKFNVNNFVFIFVAKSEEEIHHNREHIGTQLTR